VPAVDDHQVVDDAACLVGEQGVAHLPVRQAGDVANYQALKGVDAVRAEGGLSMCETSNSTAAARAWACSAMMPVYCSGIS